MPLSKTRESFMSLCFDGVQYQKDSFAENCIISQSLSPWFVSVFAVSHARLYLTVRFIMHSVFLSMQSHNTDGRIIVLCNLQNHGYHFCVLKEQFTKNMSVFNHSHICPKPLAVIISV